MPETPCILTTRLASEAGTWTFNNVYPSLREAVEYATALIEKRPDAEVGVFELTRVYKATVNVTFEEY